MIHSNLSVKDGRLQFAGYDVCELAKKYSTPLMLLDENMIRANMSLYKTVISQYFPEGSMPLLASKALSFKEIYRIAKSEGIGTDIVSVGELYTAKQAGFDMSKAFFHGNNKSDSDILFAMECGIGHFVVDTFDELASIERLATKEQKVLLRLTPGIDPHTHVAVSTGRVDSKFGTAIETGQAFEIVKKALEMKNVHLSGFHCHIGSQIFDIKPFCDAADIMLDFIAKTNKELGFMPEYLNLGGGFGVRYVESHPVIDVKENIKNIFCHIDAKCKEYGVAMPKILFEPGRSIVAAAGLTAYTVGSIKQIPGYKNYVSIDGGMTDNPRYALYQSEYTVAIANKMDEPCDFVATVSGRCCESGDLIGENMAMPKPQRGDILTVFVTGAYNYSMASNYNRVCRPAIVMLGKTDRVVVKRESLEDLVRLDV
ncbi:MAG: diaminopimelate decarboxylase [Christensenellaceae bacterium]